MKPTPNSDRFSPDDKDPGDAHPEDANVTTGPDEHAASGNAASGNEAAEGDAKKSGEETEAVAEKGALAGMESGSRSELSQMENPDGAHGEQLEDCDSTHGQSQSEPEEIPKWLADVPDTDLYGILEAPIEDRARLLAATRSTSVDDVMESIADQVQLPVLKEFELAESPTKHVPLRIIHDYCCLPVAKEVDGKLLLVTPWPPSDCMSRWVFAVSGRKPLWHLGHPEVISRSITENFGIGADSLEDSDLDLEDEEVEDDVEDQNAAIIRFVNEVVLRAIVDRATDIHFEPRKETLQIRYRIDGQLVPVRVPDNLRSFQDAIISRIKIMSGINISEKRRPQGGRINFAQGQSDLDIRVSTLPTMYGESISLRLLNEKSQPLSMDELGLLPQDQAKIGAILDKPHGIALVTGPTGSGKSTSLTAFIRRINLPERRIMTVEDPVEYEVAGVNQTQVNSEIGFNFASALREILRQDPDVIMVGEIRDRETADIAIRASLTGHLVLSTLHTNDAPGAITRLIDMEIEPFLIASSVEMIMAQRLVRRLCKNCAEPARLDRNQLLGSFTMLGIDPNEAGHGNKVLKSTGCNKCQNLGYRGRVGIFEIMLVSDTLHSLVINNASAPEIRKVALEDGMSTLQANGWEQIKLGRTTFDEVMRYAEGYGEEIDDARVKAATPTAPPFPVSREQSSSQAPPMPPLP